MKTCRHLIPLLIAALTAPLFSSCSSAPKKNPEVAAAAGASRSDGKAVQADELDEYEIALIADPIEPVNRGTFWLNHQIYRFVLRPVSKTYETVIPKPVRTGVFNVFDNIAFPVRFVNDTLQGNFKRAGQETGKFVINSTLGVAGIMRPSEKFPTFADVPGADTGQTFAKWGIGHGPYIVLPIIGPSSARDTVGLAGDYALNPVSWVSILFGGYYWTIAISATDTVRGLPGRFGSYDGATKNSLDPYLAARSAYSQYRKEAKSR